MAAVEALPPAQARALVRTARQGNGTWRKLVILAVILAAWSAAVTWWLPSYLPTPWGVVTAVPGVVQDPAFRSALGASFGSMVVGTVIGVTLGTAFGVVRGRIGLLKTVSAPWIDGAYALPLLVIVPPTTIWLGYTSDARLAMVILAAFLPCAVTTADGVAHLPKTLEEVTAVFRATPRSRVFDLVVPGALPYIIAGLHVAVGRAIIATVSVEFIASIEGLGTFIQLNARSFNQNAAFVAVLILAAFGGGARLGVQWLLRRLAPWHVAMQPT